MGGDGRMEGRGDERTSREASEGRAEQAQALTRTLSPAGTTAHNPEQRAQAHTHRHSWLSSSNTIRSRLRFFMSLVSANFSHFVFFFGSGTGFSRGKASVGAGSATKVPTSEFDFGRADSFLNRLDKTAVACVWMNSSRRRSPFRHWRDSNNPAAAGKQHRPARTAESRAGARNNARHDSVERAGTETKRTWSPRSAHQQGVSWSSDASLRGGCPRNTKADTADNATFRRNLAHLWVDGRWIEGVQVAHVKLHQGRIVRTGVDGIGKHILDHFRHGRRCGGP